MNESGPPVRIGGKKGGIEEWNRSSRSAHIGCVSEHLLQGAELRDR